MSSAGRGVGGVGPYATRVAAIAALLIVLAALLLVLAGSRERYEIRAVFDDVRGLIPGGDVTAGSIEVGTVTEVKLNADDEPEVTMEIDGDYTLYRGAVADIRLGSNVGAVNRVVDLSEGDPRAGELEDGAVLSGRQTDNPVNIDQAVATLTPKVRGDVKRVLIGLDDALRDRGPDIDRTLRYSARSLNETANLLARVRSNGRALRTLLSQGRVVVSALAESPQDLGAAAERTAALLRITAGRQAELDQTVQLLGPALARGRVLLERADAAIPTLRELLAGAGPLLDELGPFARVVPDAARAAGPFVAETKRLVRGAPRQLRLQEPFLRAAPPVVTKLVPMTRRLNPVVDQMRVFTPETIGFFQNVADSAASFDRNGHLIRTGSISANELPPSTAAGGEIGPSDCEPGQLAPPYMRTPGVNECVPWESWQDSLGDGG